MKQTHYVTIVAVVFSIVIWTHPVLANAGVPMIFIIMPPAIILVVPIILIEGLLAKFILQKPWTYCFQFSGICNVLSTCVGIPATWLILVIFQMLSDGSSAKGLDSIKDYIYAVTIQAPWLFPYESELDWMIPVAATVLTVIFWLISIVIEALIGLIIRKEKSLSWLRVIIWSIGGNTMTYIPVISLLVFESYRNLNLKGYI